MDGPSSINGVRRQVINFKALSLTGIVVPISRGARLKHLTKVWKAEGIEDKWNKTPEARRLAVRAARAAANDFDRFKVRHARKQRAMAMAK